jgi:hypothetical protein
MLQVRSDEEPLRQRRAIRIAALIATALFMENLDSNIIVTALPQMARSFGPPIGLNIGVTRLHARSGRRYSNQRLNGGSLRCPGRVHAAIAIFTGCLCSSARARLPGPARR